MFRFISFIVAAALLTACASELQSRASETINGYKASQEASLRSIAAIR